MHFELRTVHSDMLLPYGAAEQSTLPSEVLGIWNILTLREVRTWEDALP